jgi:hypothetical protein
MKTYVDFIRANSNYLSRATEDALAIHHNLTLGCWVWFDEESTDNETGIISKWVESWSQRSYVLYKNASNEIVFSVSHTGADSFSVSNSGVGYAENQWFYVVGRFTPQSELKLFVNGWWFSNTTSIPVDIYNSSSAFEIGRYNASNYLDGRVAQAFLCAYSVPDRFVCSMYSHSKALFMDKFKYPNYCADYVAP